MTRWMPVMFVLAACGPGLGAAATENLTDSVRLYNDGVRWQRWETAASYLPVKDRSKWVDDEDERGKDLKITDYDVVRIDPKGDTAKVQIKMSWYKTTEATVHETHAMQTWERHGKNWLLVDETRQRGDEMPGLPEPLMKDEGSGSDAGSASK
jgi:hypothetical protein